MIIDLLDKFSIDGSTALIIVLVILLLAIIGYYADKTKFAREKGEPKDKKKAVKKDIAAVGINDIANNVDKIENVNEEAKVEASTPESTIPDELFAPLEEAKIDEQIEESVKASIDEVEEEMNKPAEPMVFDEEPNAEAAPQEVVTEEVPAQEPVAVAPMTFDEPAPVAPETTPVMEEPMATEPVNTNEEIAPETVEQPVEEQVAPAEEEQQPVEEQSVAEEPVPPTMAFYEELAPIEEAQPEPVAPVQPVEEQVTPAAEEQQPVEEQPATMPEEEKVPEELFAPVETQETAPVQSNENLFVDEAPQVQPQAEQKPSVLDDDFGINDLPTLKINKESNDNLAVDDIFKI